MNTMKGFSRTGLTCAGALALAGLVTASQVRAEQVAVPLLAQTSFVSGSVSEDLTFQAPTAGTVTVSMQNLAWPTLMSNLNFSANTATQMLSDWSASDGAMDTETFNVGPGTYFAHITGQTGSDMGGLFSAVMTFTPLTTVPLPAAGWMFVTGLFVFFGLVRVLREFKPLEPEAVPA